MLQVIAGCTQRRGLLPMLERQLDEAGIAFHVEPFTDIPNGVGNIGWKLEYLRKMLDKFRHASHLVFTDAFDVLFYGTEEDVISKIPNGYPLMAAERNCWPDSYLAPNFTGDTPWRYVNGGLMAGTPQGISDWCDAVQKHPAYHYAFIDQQWLNHRRLEGSKLTHLDTRTDLFYCCVHDQGELQFENGMPVNLLCGTMPNWVHLNGQTEVSTFLTRRMVSLPMYELAK